MSAIPRSPAAAAEQIDLINYSECHKSADDVLSVEQGLLRPGSFSAIPSPRQCTPFWYLWSRLFADVTASKYN